MARVRSYSRLRSRTSIWPSRKELNFDQVAEVDDLVLVAIADEDVEIGVDHADLIAPGDLEGRGLDAIGLVRLASKSGFLAGSTISTLTLPLPGDLVLFQHIRNVGHQRREQRVGALAEIAADEQWLLQLGQQIAVVYDRVYTRAAASGPARARVMG